MPATSLSAEEVRRLCAPEQLSFETTADLTPPEGIVGQARAVEAIRFGMAIRRAGYNLFVRGPTGMGKHYFVRRFLTAKAAQEPTPSDWCYVENFSDPMRPRALHLPAGTGCALVKALKAFVRELKPALEMAFEGEKFRVERAGIEREFREAREVVLDDIKRRARAMDVVVVEADQGVQLSFLHQGEPLGEDAFKGLELDEQKRLQDNMQKVYDMLQEELRNVPRWEREKRKRMRELQASIARGAVSALMQELLKSFGAHTEVAEHLDGLAEDVVENAPVILGEEEDEDQAGILKRYAVNLLVDHAESEGAPVVFADRIDLDELVGRLEYRSRMGVLETDFSLIKPGALHRANGGYLILEAMRLLSDSDAWETLKRCLRSSCVRLEPPTRRALSTESIEPEPIPLDVKVVLIGERSLYRLLCKAEPEFQKFFKVLVDFEEDMPRDAEGVQAYARLIATLTGQERLRPLDPAAVARAVEFGARQAEHADKLSVRVHELFDLVREADYWAGEAGRETVNREDVVRALEASREREGRLRDRLLEEVIEGVVGVRTDGAVCGQVNGLSVIQPGRVAFGKIGRITASVRFGRGEVVDIEREVELGGPLHSKGVLILSGYLSARYCPQEPLALAARLVFEQSYGGVDGDSATAAEMCALLSALAEAPLAQRFAITGSMDQHGNIQAVGGVNEKIEGFFDIVRARGLDDREEVPGVLLPRANARHLMLREEVVDAVRAGRFQVIAIETVDQALEILCGSPAGERDAAGSFPAGSLNARIEARLAGFAEVALRYRG